MGLYLRDTIGNNGLSIISRAHIAILVVATRFNYVLVATTRSYGSLLSQSEVLPGDASKMLRRSLYLLGLNTICRLPLPAICFTWVC